MPRRFPTLRQRIIAARQRLPNSPTMKAANENAASFIIDPSLAKSILAKHELLIRRSSSSSSSSLSSSSNSDGSESSEKNPRSSSKMQPQQYANLEKPTKPTKLLNDALTNANGYSWTRQRYCVSRAFAVKKVTRDAYANYAVDKVMGLIHDVVMTDSNIQRKTMRRRTAFSCIRNLVQKSKDRRTVDIRVFAREVAIHTLVKIVFGDVLGSKNNETIIINSLRNMVRDTLELRRDEEYSKESESIVDKLDRVVKETIEHISNNANNDASGQECLVQRLLAYEQHQDHGNVEDKNYLTRDEIVGNSHSALLAGVQTISTTLTGVLLHLAERPDLQYELKEGSLSGKDVVNETLRILPPVAGLPRKPTKCDLEIVRENIDQVVPVEGGGTRSCPIRKGNVVVVDLLAFAHMQPREDLTGGSANAANDINDFSTLKFNPKKKHKTEAKPWGMGKRKCPAGIISMECIGAAMEAIAKGSVTWALANPKRDCVGEQYIDGWFETITYRPTLSYGEPLYIKFHSQRDSV